MPPNRLEMLKQFVEKQPNDPFPRYGLAMELKNAGQRDEAVAAFATLEEKFPDYVPQYLMHAKLLVEMGRGDDARRVLERGIPIAQRRGDMKAAGEMQGELEGL